MELKKANITVEPRKWERFKRLCKLKNSDASKQIRQWIDQYLVENQQLWLETEARDAEKKN
jgi:hypothetical protein